MKHTVWICTIIAAVLSSFPVAAARGSTITVRVSTFRSLKGSLRCRLYSRPDGFPGKPPYEAQQSVTVTAKTMSCIFASVAPGTYAVALFHDENNDGQARFQLHRNSARGRRGLQQQAPFLRPSLLGRRQVHAAG